MERALQENQRQLREDEHKDRVRSVGESKLAIVNLAQRCAGHNRQMLAHLAKLESMGEKGLPACLNIIRERMQDLAYLAESASRLPPEKLVEPAERPSTKGAPRPASVAPPKPAPSRAAANLPAIQKPEVSLYVLQYRVDWDRGWICLVEIIQLTRNPQKKKRSSAVPRGSASLPGLA